MENLNLVELLRDCPTGIELDSLVFDNVIFDYVNTQQNRVYCKVDKSESVWFTPKGGVNLLPAAKCVIFPKGKITWEGFVPPCQFKDGDIVICAESFQGYEPFIYREIDSEKHYGCYCGIHRSANSIYSKPSDNWADRTLTLRLANYDEKKRLFATLARFGYKWNAETKTLEKLIEPKFKVGDRIRHKETNKDDVYKISKVYDDSYGLVGFTWMIYMEYQDQYELVPDKFDITTLKPFESKVLVRDYDNRIWIPTFFGKYLEDDSNCRCLTTNGCYKYCIPYEGNEHLLGTANDCDDYYKTWKK